MPKSQSDMEREVDWQMCQGLGPNDVDACIYWCRKFCKIRHPERGRIAFELREAQLETIDAWLTERYTIVLKARQVGYSTLAAAISLWLTFFWSDKYVIMLSKTEREAQKLFAKAAYAYRFLPQWMKDRGPKEVQKTLQKLSFDNESQIECLPSTEDPARGESAYLVIVDEWAFLTNPEEAWASIEPVADVGGRVIGLSTANGSGNFFHELWMEAVEGVGRFRPMFYPWSANSDRDESWYARKKAEFARRPWILHQEYPRNPEEAFIRSGRSVFDLDLLDLLVPEPPHTGVLAARFDWDQEQIDFVEHTDGELLLFEPPVPGCTYAVGADVAEGLEHGDFSAAHVIDTQTMSVVAVWHGHVAPDLFANVLFRLGHFYNVALVGVESNNHGMTTLTALREHKYPRIFYQTSVGTKRQRRTERLGWFTTQVTKPYVIDGLATAMRGERSITREGDVEWLGGLDIRDANTIREMRTFVKEPDGRQMHGSPHDDRVMSLAIAAEMTKFVHSPQYVYRPAEEWGTLSWWESQAREKDKVERIGAHNMRH